MKRSAPPRRKAPMKRKTPMKRISERTKKVKAETDPARRAFRESVGACMLCMMQLPPSRLEVHEIAAGHAREKCLYEQSLQMVLCRKCHRKLQHAKPAKQIAARVRWDIRQLCAKYCELRGLAVTAVEFEDVITFLYFGERL